MNEKDELFMISDIYGEDVFSDKVMRTRLPKNVYNQLHQVDPKTIPLCFCRGGNAIGPLFNC